MSRVCEACKRTSVEDLVLCDYCGHELGTPYPLRRPREPEEPKPAGPCQHRNVDPGSSYCNDCGLVFPRRTPR